MGFHTILTLAYLIPGIYLFARIWQLFIPKESRLMYILVFAVVFMIYPLSNFAGEGGTGILSKMLVAFSNFLLPFFLYLFLLVLLTDLILLINMIFRVVPAERIRTGSFRIKALIVIICLSLLIDIAGIINFNTIRISHYSITIQKRSSGLDHLRIAYISDFHLQEGTPVRFVNKAVQRINEVQPDLMVFGGDIVEGDRESENMRVFEDLLKGINSKYGVYGVLGNHEHYARQDKGSFFNRAGIKILIDSTVFLGRSFILAGRNDGHIRTRKTLDELLRSIPDSLPILLADHRPTELKQVGETKTDVQLSGHTHNGQLFPINFITRKVYELSMGYKKFGHTHVFVSSGLRLWGPPVRTTGKSEIVVVDIIFNR
jgi:uncharacterized protein